MVKNVDEKIKVILGILLDQTPEMSRKILSVYNYSDSFSTNIKALSSLTSIGAKSSFSRPAVVEVVDQLELFIHLQLRS